MKISKQIGELVINKLSLSMLQNSRGTYDINNYIKDFNGTPEELNIELIKLASNEL